MPTSRIGSPPPPRPPRPRPPRGPPPAAPAPWGGATSPPRPPAPRAGGRPSNSPPARPAAGAPPSPSAVLERWTLELDALAADGGLFMLTNHPFVSGRASRAVALAELI